MAKFLKFCLWFFVFLICMSIFGAIMSGIKERKDVPIEASAPVVVTPESKKLFEEKVKIAQEKEKIRIEEETKLKAEQKIQNELNEKKAMEDVRVMSGTVLKESKEIQKEIETKLKKYYPTKADMDKLIKLQKQLIIVVLANNEHSKAAEKDLEKISALKKKTFTSFLEQVFLKHGYDVTVKISGKQDENITLSYILMSRVLSYNLHNTQDFKTTFQMAGFKNVTYTDGDDYSVTYEIE